MSNLSADDLDPAELRRRVERVCRFLGERKLARQTGLDRGDTIRGFRAGTRRTKPETLRRLEAGVVELEERYAWLLGRSRPQPSTEELHDEDNVPAGPLSPARDPEPESDEASAPYGSAPPDDENLQNRPIETAAGEKPLRGPADAPSMAHAQPHTVTQGADTVPPAAKPPVGRVPQDFGDPALLSVFAWTKLERLAGLYDSGASRANLRAPLGEVGRCPDRPARWATDAGCRRKLPAGA